MKIFSITKTFNKKQRADFLTYLELYHKPKTVVWKVADWLNSMSIWKANSEKEYTTEKILAELPFEMKSQTLYNTLTTLGNVAEEYVGWMVWKDSNNLKKSCQLLGLAQKSLSEQYDKTKRGVLKETDNKIISIWDEHYKMYALFNDYYFEISSSDDNYTDEFNQLIKAFRKSSATIAQFLLVEIRNREKLLPESWEHQESFLNLLYQNDTELRFITDQLIKMNHLGDFDAYDNLLLIIRSDNVKRLSKSIQYSIVTYCINFLTAKIKEGAVHRGQELLDLYEYSLEKGIFILNDSMPIKKFINIIGLASKLERYDWARIVVDNWAFKVDKYNSKSVAKFGHATIDLHEKKYKSVIDTLLRLKSSNFQHKLRSRWLLLRAQFELYSDNVNIMKIQIDNFRRFIVSNERRINKPTYVGIKSSIKILNLILDRKTKGQLDDFYKSCNFMYERKWILEKIKNPVR